MSGALQANLGSLPERPSPFGFARGMKRMETFFEGKKKACERSKEKRRRRSVSFEKISPPPTPPAGGENQEGKKSKRGRIDTPGEEKGGEN